MPKITLTDAWMYAGTTYLPGEHKVSDELARIFESRGAIPATAQPAAAAAPASTGTENLPAPSTPPAPEADPLIDLVGPDAAASLKAAGYGSVEAWRTADDATLLALEHVGKATVKKLRDAQGQA
jgi:nitroreductase